MLVETARASGLGRLLAYALARWRAPRAAHDPGRVVLDLAVAIALGGDCLADVAVVRAQPELFAPGRLGPDRVAAGRYPRRRLRGGGGSDPCCPRRGPAGGLGASLPGAGIRSGDRGSGRDDRGGAFDQGKCQPDV